MYGWRGRVGLIVPSSNTTMEPEFWRMAPEGVSIHTTRLKLVEVTPEALKQMAFEAIRAAEELPPTTVGVVPTPPPKPERERLGGEVRKPREVEKIVL